MHLNALFSRFIKVLSITWQHSGVENNFKSVRSIWMTELHCLTFIHKDQELICLAINWFLLQQVKDKSCVYPEVWFTKDPSLLSQGRLDAEMEDGRWPWRLTAQRYMSYASPHVCDRDINFLISVFRKLFITILTSGATESHSTLRGKDWVWFPRNQVANLLEHTLLQDLPRYEDRPQDKILYHLQARHLAVLANRWRPIPRHLTWS